MTLRFAVVHEAKADFEIATELADRVLLETIDWLDEHVIASQRQWIEEVPSDRRLEWKTLPQLAREIGIRAHGYFSGDPGQPDAAAARRAILYVLATISDLTAILLIRDQDDQPERRVGLEQARSQDRSGVVTVVGLAVVERESWVICAFDPQGAEETARLDAERRTLGFDPRLRSHELTACKNDQAPRSPKRVLRVLSGDDRGRERHCWMNAPLNILRERGGENGLSGYLQEIRDRLGPLIGHVAKG
jgi:hypothetical protein